MNFKVGDRVRTKATSWYAPKYGNLTGTIMRITVDWVYISMDRTQTTCIIDPDAITLSWCYRTSDLIHEKSADDFPEVV